MGRERSFEAVFFFHFNPTKAVRYLYMARVATPVNVQVVFFYRHIYLRKGKEISNQKEEEKDTVFILETLKYVS